MRRALALAVVAAAAAMPAAAQAQSVPGWPVSCVRDNVTVSPLNIEAYWLITCIAPIIP